MKAQTFFLAMSLLAILPSCGKGNDSANADDSISKAVTTDRDEYELRGDVAIVQINTYSAYEENGELVKGELQSSEKITFNEDGKFIMKQTGDEWKDVYSYNDNLRKEEIYMNGEMYSCIYKYYNMWGGDSLRISCLANGKEISRVTYSYNNRKQLIEEAYYDNEEMLIAGKKNVWCSNYEYDENGNLIGYGIYTDGSTKYEQIITNKYNEANQMVESINVSTIGSNTTKNTSTYEYNDHGFKSKWIHGAESIEYNNTETIEYTYEYDTKGNYTSCTLYHYSDNNWTGETEKSVMIIEREITYFE